MAGPDAGLAPVENDPIADVGGKVADTTRTPFHQSEFFALLFS